MQNSLIGGLEKDNNILPVCPLLQQAFSVDNINEYKRKTYDPKIGQALLEETFYSEMPDKDTCSIVSLHDGHPNCTDGRLDLEEFLLTRKEVGIDQVAISDHNTLVTNKRAIELINNSYSQIKIQLEGLSIISSIELSVGGKFPGHFILLDFDINEFDNIFYEKYLQEYILKYFSRRDDFPKAFLDKVKSGEQLLTQPSEFQDKITSEMIDEAIIEMRNNGAYENIIFPGESLEEVLSKLRFHFEKGNISKIPIFEIPHPKLGEFPGLSPMKSLVWGKNKMLEKEFRTTYGGLAVTEESKEYTISVLKGMKRFMEERGERFTLLFEGYNEESPSDRGDNKDLFEEFKQLGAIYCTGLDGHGEKTPVKAITIPRNKTIREILESKDFSKAIITDLCPQEGEDSFMQKIKDSLFLGIFGVRWFVDSVCNEHMNLSVDVPDIDVKKSKDRDAIIDMLKGKKKNTFIPPKLQWSFAQMLQNAYTKQWKQKEEGNKKS